MHLLRFISIFSFALVFTSFAEAPLPTETWLGKVVAITDGDTIEVIRNGKAEKIRLHGIDCPEEGQPFGTKAKQFTGDMCFGKTVTVQVVDIDRYGRKVANVVLPNRTVLNLALVQQGLAWWYREFAPRDFELQKAQSKATIESNGLWSEPQPIAPWNWRDGKQSHQFDRTYGSTLGTGPPVTQSRPAAAKQPTLGLPTYQAPVVPASAYQYTPQ